jgi:hypothetical protein
LYVVATQAAEGKVNGLCSDFGLEAVRDLRQLLRPHKSALHDVTYTEAMRFLDRAERGLTRVRMIQTGSGGAHP